MKERILEQFRFFYPLRRETSPPLQDERGLCRWREPNLYLNCTSLILQTEYGHPGNILFTRGGDHSCEKSRNTVHLFF